MEEATIRKANALTTTSESVLFENKSQLIDRFQVDYRQGNPMARSEVLGLEFRQVGPFFAPLWPPGSIRQDYPAGIRVEWKLRDNDANRTVLQTDSADLDVELSTTGSQYKKEIMIPPVDLPGKYFFELTVSLLDSKGVVLHRPVKDLAGNSVVKDLTTEMDIEFFTGCDSPSDTQIVDVVLPEIVTTVRSPGVMGPTKWIDLKFAETKINFTTEAAENETVTCQARSEVSALPVSVLYLGVLPIFNAESVGSALVQLIDGPDQKIRWSNGEGFQAQKFDFFGFGYNLLRPVPRWQTAIEFPLSDVNPSLKYPESSFETILRESEAYIHRYLSKYWFGFLEDVTLFWDPGDTTMRVTDAMGRETGNATTGQLVSDIPNSIYFADGPLVMLFGREGSIYNTKIAAKSRGVFQFSVVNFDGGVVLSPQEFLVGTSENGVTEFTTVFSPASGVPLTTAAKDSQSHENTEYLGNAENEVVTFSRMVDGNYSLASNTGSQTLIAESMAKKTIVSQVGRTSTLIWNTGPAEVQDQLAGALFTGSGDDGSLLVDEQSLLDLSLPSSPLLYGYGVVGFKKNGGGALRLDAASVRRLDTGLVGAVKVLHTEGNQFSLLDTGGWRITSINFANGIASLELKNDETLLSVDTFLTSHNFVNPLDTNNDGDVSPMDVLTVINFLNDPVARKWPIDIRADASKESWRFLDVNGDRFVSPIDALLVINELNNKRRHLEAAAESEPTTSGTDLAQYGTSVIEYAEERVKSTVDDYIARVDVLLQHYNVDDNFVSVDENRNSFDHLDHAILSFRHHTRSPHFDANRPRGLRVNLLVSSERSIVDDLQTDL